MSAQVVAWNRGQKWDNPNPDDIKYMEVLLPEALNARQRLSPNKFETPDKRCPVTENSYITSKKAHELRQLR